MALPLKEQARYWGIAAVLFLVILWFLGDVILPFVLGMAVAYCLDPVADKLEDWGLSRGLAVAVISIAALVIFVIMALAIVPTIVSQATQLISAAPEYLNRLRDWLIDRFPDLMVEDSAIRQQLSKIATAVEARGSQLISSLLGSFSGVLNILVLFLIVPVVSVYLLIDWDRMVARVDELLPRDHAPVIRKLARDMDATLASFIRGQGTVCLILGVFYAAALMIAGLNFGLVIGAIAGLVTFIPYVGAIVGGVLAVGVAIFQTWTESSADVAAGVEGATVAVNWIYVLIIAAIFQAGQLVEGNILTPNLVGSSVGLHPVWLLFALSVFGALFGFVGMLVAVPVAAMIGVLVRFGIDQYQQSRLYRGLSDQD